MEVVVLSLMFQQHKNGVLLIRCQSLPIEVFCIDGRGDCKQQVSSVVCMHEFLQIAFYPTLYSFLEVTSFASALDCHLSYDHKEKPCTFLIYGCGIEEVGELGPSSWLSQEFIGEGRVHLPKLVCFVQDILVVKRAISTRTRVEQLVFDKFAWWKVWIELLRVHCCSSFVRKRFKEISRKWLRWEKTNVPHLECLM